MRDYQFLVTDDRNAVRSLLFVQTRDVSSARAAAERLVSNNQHCQAVEVWDDRNRPFTIAAGRIRPTAETS